MLMKIIFASFLFQSLLANDMIKLNQQITSTIQPRQNQIFKIESCGDVEVEIKVKGIIVIEAGPARTMSQKGFQEDIKLEISNQNKQFNIKFPFVYYNSSTRICMIYLSVYGQVNNSQTNQDTEFEFIAKPYLNNNIQIAQIDNQPQTPLFYSKSIAQDQDMFILLKGDALKNQTLNIQIVDLSPESQQQNLEGQDNQAQNVNQLPSLVFNQSGQEISAKKKKSSENSEQKNKNYSLISKSNFLDFNQQQSAIMKSESVMLLVENSSSPNRMIQIFKQNVSQFQLLENLKEYQFTGLNFQLKKGEKQNIIVNNEGCFILEIFTKNPESLKIYLNTKTPDVDHIKLELRFLKINSYTQYAVLQQVYLPDSIEVTSNEDTDVLFQLKPYSQKTFQEATKPRDDYFKIHIDDDILQICDDADQKIEQAYIFMSQNKENLEKNIIIGESVKDLVYFTRVNPNKCDLKSILEKLSNFSKIYIAVRAYDELKKSYISEIQLIDNSFSSTISFTFTNIILIIIISLALVGAIIYLILRGIQEKKIIKQPDEQELIRGSVHVRMPSENTY